MLNLDTDVSAISLEETALLYRQAREVRLAMEKEVARVAALEKRCKDRIISEQVAGTGFVVGGYAFVVTVKEKPTLRDFDKAFAWAVENDRPDIFQKRLADKAVTDTENWHLIPGVERFNHLDLSVTKR